MPPSGFQCDNQLEHMTDQDLIRFHLWRHSTRNWVFQRYSATLLNPVLLIIHIPSVKFTFVHSSLPSSFDRYSLALVGGWNNNPLDTLLYGNLPRPFLILRSMRLRLSLWRNCSVKRLWWRDVKHNFVCPTSPSRTRQGYL